MNLIISSMLLISINQFSIETPNYKLVKKYKNFEIRDYDKMIFAHTMIKQRFKESTNTGFRRIANYIFGGWATENRTKCYIDQLVNSLKKEEIDPVGDIMVAQYNSPWVIPPFRKNEIIIPIK